MRSNSAHAKLALLIVAVLWGSSFAFQQELVESTDAVIFTFYNFAAATIVFFIYVLWKKKNILFRLREGIILGFLLALMEVTQMYGLDLSTAANTSFISNMGMLGVPFLGWLIYKHSFRGVHVFSIALAIFGLYFLVGGIDGLVKGDIVLLVSAVAMGLYFLYSERFESESGSHMSVLCFQQFLVVSVITFVVHVFFSNSTLSINPEYISSLFWQIFFFTIIPYSLIQWASKYSNEMVTAMYDGVLEPLVGGIVAWVLFFEVATTYNIAGGIIMVVAFGISVIFSKRRHFLSKN
jgi:drug/metabolite transporter (DMT)-like permease